MSGPSVNPYLPPTLTGYNSNPPTNDGQKIPANLIKWDQHLDNIGNPIVNFSGDINTQVSAAFGKTVNTDAGVHSAIGGSIGFDLQNAVINSDALVANKNNVEVDTEAAAATDDLVTLTGSNSTEGTIYWLKSASAARVVTVKHGAGNIFNFSQADVTLDPNHSRAYQKKGSNFYEFVVGESIPTGSMTAFGGASAPTGWLLCDGAAVSRTTYAALFSVIGETYGNGDGTTTFNLPDKRDRVSVGAGSSYTLGSKGGVATRNLSISNLPATHRYATGGQAGIKGIVAGADTSVWEAPGTIQTGGGAAFGIVQPYEADTWIIKT